jgi:Tfp pilus assembly protein PilX
MNTMHKQRGAVSIFIVMFTALLVTIVTASFVQIMLRNQQQASNNDLSQSAYDSALAGVEDAKRALVALKACDKNPSLACNNLRSALVNNGQNCEVLADPSVGVTTFSNGESQVGRASMNQAYTCVKVQVVTDSYEGTLDKDQSVVIPLETVDDPNTIAGIRISWFTQDNIPDVDSSGNAISQVPKYPTQPQLPTAGSWSVQYPSIMRSQFIQFQDGNLTLDSFDAANTNNAKTLFLYPAIFGATNLDFAADGRQSPSSRNYPAISRCDTTFSLNGGYACSTDVAVPALGGGTRKAYLQLTSLYNKSTYKIQILGGSGNVINFDNVQPVVDSTGRASDLFRRIRARVALSEGMPTTYPDAALHLGKSLCKDFFVTGSSSDYNGDTDTVACAADQ